MNDEKILGFCIWFNLKRGFGFIQGEDGNSYFIHTTKIILEDEKNIEIGQTVKFYPSSCEKGPFALELEVL